MTDDLCLSVGGTPLERVLVVMAHPDDVDFSAAGTVAGWCAAGVAVSYCLCTDGDAGGFDRSVPRPEMARVRRAEQTAAATAVGVTDLHWLGFPDGALVASLDLRRAIARVIRQVRPQRVVCGTPLRSLQSVYTDHPDHLAAGEAALCAVYPDARNPFAFPELLGAEGLEPHAVAEVWLLTGGSERDRVVDITDRFGQKLEALRCHVSQRTDADGRLAERLREWNTQNGADGGLAEGRMAESFRFLATA